MPFVISIGTVENELPVIIVVGVLNGRLMLQLIGEKSFGAFARCRQNGFVGLTVCFMTVSRQRLRDDATDRGENGWRQAKTPSTVR
ncbi:hypothetical protein [Bradyrhizobium sp. SRS-191]|uniref:hypothetical protein n=1 Tax=Bradyrhizobium sp. SRS-191 TaxID=2962606 RepID=UPI00211E2CCE|nr:hypothetical protein [Bradyrhizobium sp. SRS-191]